MKKRLKILATGVCLLMSGIIISCSDQSDKKATESDVTNDETIKKASREELEAAVKERDQLLELVSQINQDVNDIKHIEGLLNNPSQGETPSAKDQLKSDLGTIKQRLEERKARLAALEEQLKKSNLANSNMRKTIADLQAQIDTQRKDIERLNTMLGAAQNRIAGLEASTDSLNTVVTNVTDERNIAQQEAIDAANELNRCYYVIGTSSELKALKILDGGGLFSKTKLTKEELNTANFTSSDKRSLDRITVPSKNIKIYTTHPEGSYTITKSGNSTILEITDPSAFWQRSNILVIQQN